MIAKPIEPINRIITVSDYLIPNDFKGEIVPDRSY